MQVKIQRKGHPVETLTDPTFEQCFNTAGKMQCEFIDLTGAVSLPVTAAPTQATKTVHTSDQDNKAPVEYGFAQTAGEFGQIHLPQCLDRHQRRGRALQEPHVSRCRLCARCRVQHPPARCRRCHRARWFATAARMKPGARYVLAAVLVCPMQRSTGHSIPTPEDVSGRGVRPILARGQGRDGHRDERRWRVQSRV